MAFASQPKKSGRSGGKEEGAALLRTEGQPTGCGSQQGPWLQLSLDEPMDRPFPVGERAADKTRDPKLKITLLALPADLVHHVLMRDEIRDLELCRLECTAWLMKSLVDEAAWCRAFLQRRRGNVLRQPASWKEELMCRDRMPQWGSNPADWQMASSAL